MNSFVELGLRDELVAGLKKVGILEPTPIQVKAIPSVLSNRDIIGESETGSGKTLAYLLPLFQKIDTSKREMQCIILAPTHELAMQIDNEIKLLSNNSGMPVTSTTIIGDANINRQIEKLREKPHIIVGSVGRIFQLIKLKKISAHTVKTIVIDEADMLLNVNNIAGVKDIIKTTLKERQLMAFSASITEKAIHSAKDLMKEPEIIKIEKKIIVNPNITHLYIPSEQRDKFAMLRKLIAAVNPEKAIIFVNKGDEVERATSKLKYHNFKVYGIYGSSEKEERKRAIEGFRSGKYNLLVASDLAARGLDIKDVTHIINLDLPEDPKEYLHRVGRTSRAGKSGTAISIVSERELPLIKKLERDFQIQIQEKDVYEGRVIDLETRGKVINKKPQK